MASSPMSEIHPPPLQPRSTRNGGCRLPPRPSSVLEDPSYFPPLSPPPDFHSGYMSDVPTSNLNGGTRGRPRRGSRPETALTLSSFKPIPSISQPTPEEIQRDVDIVFHNLGLDSQSPIRDHETLMSQDAVNGYNLQDAVDYNLDEAMCHSITEEGMLLGAPPPPRD